MFLTPSITFNKERSFRFWLMFDFVTLVRGGVLEKAHVK